MIASPCWQRLKEQEKNGTLLEMWRALITKLAEEVLIVSTEASLRLFLGGGGRYDEAMKCAKRIDLLDGAGASLGAN